MFASVVQIGLGSTRRDTGHQGERRHGLRPRSCRLFLHCRKIYGIRLMARLKGGSFAAAVQGVWRDLRPGHIGKVLRPTSSPKCLLQRKGNTGPTAPRFTLASSFTSGSEWLWNYSKYQPGILPICL